MIWILIEWIIFKQTKIEIKLRCSRNKIPAEYIKKFYRSGHAINVFLSLARRFEFQVHTTSLAWHHEIIFFTVSHIYLLKENSFLKVLYRRKSRQFSIFTFFSYFCECALIRTYFFARFSILLFQTEVFAGVKMGFSI